MHEVMNGWPWLYASVMCLFHQHCVSMHAVFVCARARDVFVTLCVTCNFDADARVCISKNTFKEPLTKASLEEPNQ